MRIRGATKRTRPRLAGCGGWRTLRDALSAWRQRSVMPPLGHDAPAARRSARTREAAPQRRASPGATSAKASPEATRPANPDGRHLHRPAVAGPRPLLVLHHQQGASGSSQARDGKSHHCNCSAWCRQ